MILLEFRDRPKKDLNQIRSFRERRKNEMYFVYVEDFIPHNSLNRRKEPTLNSKFAKEREDVFVVVGISVVKSKNDAILKTLFTLNGISNILQIQKLVI